MAFTQTIACPWTSETCALVESIIGQCNDLTCIMEKLAALGLDVTQIKSEVDNMLTFAKEFKGTFMPRTP